MTSPPPNYSELARVYMTMCFLAETCGLSTDEVNYLCYIIMWDGHVRHHEVVNVFHWWQSLQLVMYLLTPNVTNKGMAEATNKQTNKQRLAIWLAIRHVAYQISVSWTWRQHGDLVTISNLPWTWDSSVSYLTTQGRAIAQAVSRRLPTAAVRVRAQVKSCGICGGQSDTGAGFLRVLRFPILILIPPTAPHSSSIIQGWYNRANSGRRTKWTQSHPTSRN
jgi:hypothetical protein